MASHRIAVLDLVISVLTAAAVAHYGWGIFAPGVGAAAAVSYNAIFAVGAIVSLRTAGRLREQGSKDSARTWQYIAAGLVCILVAQTITFVLLTPYAALVSDAVALLFYPLVIAGFWRAAPPAREAEVRWAAILDLALVWVAAATTMLALLMRNTSDPAWSDVPSLVYRTVSPSMALVAVVAVARWVVGVAPRSAVGLRVAALCTIWVAIGDLILNVFPAGWDHWSNVAWAIGVWLLVLGAQRVGRGSEAVSAVPRAVLGLSGATPFAAAGAVVFILLGTLLGSRSPEAVSLAAGGGLLVVLLVVRYALALRGAAVLDRARAAQEIRLRESERLDALGRMARGVAHDFNGMLTAILGNADLALADRDLNPEVRESLERIRDASLTASGITRQLLDFARSGAVESVDVDVSAVLRSQWRILAPTLPEVIAVELHADEGPLRIRSGAGFVEQVLFNLVSNARDAMPSGGTLRVDLHGTPTAVQLIVADSGIGMDEATRQRVFDPFFSTKGLRGTGLGLATVYGIVRQGGGEIRVDSVLGRGTTFTLDFPRSA